MVISNSQNSDRISRVQGFTLVEILVVLFLITIMAGLVVISLPSFTTTQEFDEETARMELLLQMLQSEAVLDSSEYGFRTTREGYEFLGYNDGEQKWEPLVEKPFQPRRLPDTVRLDVKADSEELAFAGEEVPPVLILSSGEMTPFKMTFESRIDRTFKTLESDGYGELTWQED